MAVSLTQAFVAGCGVQGTKMVFAGLKAPADRADLIAYLASNK
jgi:cytochrome c2